MVLRRAAASITLPRATLLLVIFVCGVLAAMEGWRVWRDYLGEIRDAKAKSLNLAKSLAQHADDRFDLADTMLASLVERTRFDGRSPGALDRLNHLLQTQVADQRRVRGLFVYDETGRRLAGSGGASIENATIGDRTYFAFHRDHADPGPYLGLPVRSHSSGQWILTVSRRLEHADGNFGGVALASFDISAFVELYERLDIGQYGTIALVRPDGPFLVRVPFDDGYPGQVATSPVFQRMIAETPAGTREYVSPIDNIERISGYQRASRYPVVVVVALARSEVLAVWRGEALSRGAIVASLILVIGAMGYWLVHQMTQRQHTERALEATLASMDEGLIMVGPAGRVEVCNGRASALLDLPLAFMRMKPTTQAVLDRQWARGEFAGLDLRYDDLRQRLGFAGGPDLYTRTRPNGVALEVRTMPVLGGGVVRTYTDITARQQAEAALRTSETCYRLLADNSTDIIALLDLSLTRTYVSPSAREVYGCSPEILMNTSPLSTVHPDDHEVVQGAFQSLADGDTWAITVHRARHFGDGSWRWVEAVYKRVLAPETGAHTGYIVNLRDVTRRQEAELAARESEARYRRLAETTSDVITHLGLPSFERTYASPSCRTLFGCEPEEMLGHRPSANNMHHDDAHATRAVAHKLAQGEVEHGTVTYRAQHKAGHWIWVEASLNLVRDPASHEPTTIVCFLRDITDRRQAEEAVRVSEARYRLLAENASDIVVHDTSDGRRAYVSPACREVLGYDPHELIGTLVEDIVHPDDTAAVMTLKRGVSAGIKQTEPMTYRLKHRDGHWIWVEASFRRINDAERDAGIVGTIRDVTERRRQAQELQNAKTEAEAATRAKTDFLASMSHEIRTPLNGVLGYTDLLLDDLDLSPAQRRKVERIQSTGSALLTVVDDILDFSKIEAGQVDLDPRPFYVEAMVDNAMSIVRGIAEAKGLALNFDLDPGLPSLLLGDENRLRQVLLNLLNNAIKFTGSGSVTLALRRMPVGPDDGASESSHVRFAVSDTGIGIPEDRRTRLFQRFSQVDGSITREFGGTGLGLAISKSLVELMGGAIGVESAVGQGSTFWFTARLETVDDQIVRVHTVNPQLVAGRSLQILLVEDVEINRDVACSVLERAGYRVTVAFDGADAVAAVQAAPYDLVLMDVQMPVMDGMTATRHIRSLAGPVARVPIIAMTANVLPSQIAEFRAAGMDDHIGKPFKRDELIALLMRWADGKNDPRSTHVNAPVTSCLIFDRNAYGSLLDDLGAPTMSSLLDKLRHQLALQLAASAGQTSSLEREALGQEAHTTVSTAGLLGFAALSEACRDLEEACSQEGTDFVALVARACQLKTATVSVIGDLLQELALAA